MTHCPEVAAGRGIFSMRLLISWLLKMYQRIQTNISRPQHIWAKIRIEMGWRSHFIFLSIKTLFLVLLFQQLAFAKYQLPSSKDILTLSDKKYQNFYQVFYEQKSKDEKNLISQYRTSWKKFKTKQERIYAYLGLIEYELNVKEVLLAEEDLKNMPAGLKFFTKEQSTIYNLIRARFYFAKKDYARCIILLKNDAYDKKHVYYDMISILYMNSLIKLNLKFEAMDYFEKNSRQFEAYLNWDDYNKLTVDISSFLIDFGYMEKALTYLNRPLLYFPLYHSGVLAMNLLSKIECSDYAIGEQFHTDKNKKLLSSQIFNRTAFNDYAKNFVLALANINEKKIIPKEPVDQLSSKEKEDLLDNLKVLISSRDYNLAKILVDYLDEAKIFTNDFKKDEILFYKGRIYNSLNEPKVSATSYQFLFEKYPHSTYAKTARTRYALSLQYAGKYQKSALFVKDNPIYESSNENDFFQFWLHYLDKNYDMSTEILDRVTKNSNTSDFAFTKAAFWQYYINNVHNKKKELSPDPKKVDFIKNLASETVNYPYPVFLRPHMDSNLSTFLQNKINILDPTIPFLEVEKSEKNKEERYCNNNKKDQGCVLEQSLKTKFFLISELSQSNLKSFAIMQMKNLLKKNLSQYEKLKMAYYSFLVSDYVSANKFINRTEKINLNKTDFSQLPEEKKVMLKLDYSLAYWSYVSRAANLLDLDPFWLLSVMRAESLYDTNAESSVGAVGLMQIMPYTGIKVLNNIKEPFNQNDESENSLSSFSISMLREPDKSIAFSSWYLKLLLDNYKGNIILATAAYNAGPAAVNRWIKQNHKFNTVEFYENIPYNETKKYVSNILGSMDMYLRIYRQHPLLLNFSVQNKLSDLVDAQELF